MLKSIEREQICRGFLYIGREQKQTYVHGWIDKKESKNFEKIKRFLEHR
jgi:hypothetical protein